MKKLLFLICIISTFVITACAFHGKQDKDDTYYKRTQSVEWPGDNK